MYDMLDHQDLTNVDKKGMAMTIRVVFISECVEWRVRTPLTHQSTLPALSA
jgi:hypothetical protein